MRNLTNDDIRVILASKLKGMLQSGVVVDFAESKRTEDEFKNRLLGLDISIKSLQSSSDEVIDKFKKFEQSLQSKLIELPGNQESTRYPNDFYKKQEIKLQPTNPHFAKEKWRKK